MLGRFILPVSRLEGFRAAAGQLLPRTLKEEAEMWEQPWLISAIIDGDLERDIDAVFAFNHRLLRRSQRLGDHRRRRGEGSIRRAGQRDWPGPSSSTTRSSMPEELFAFFEIPVLPATVNRRRNSPTSAA